MKQVWIVVLLLLTGPVFARDMKQVEKELVKALQKIEYWTLEEQRDRYTDPYDSLELANDQFEKLLLRYTALYPATLTYDFKALKENHLIIATSEDGNFRIYTWNTLTGGTMRYYKTVFQYKNARGVFSKPSPENRMQKKDPPETSGCFYYQVNDVVAGNKTYYLTQRKYVLSSAYSYHSLKVFTIGDRGLDEKAKLIKTTKGLQNEIGYEIDWSSGVNREQRREIDDAIRYDPEKKAFTFPLVYKNYKITDRRIRYVFTGTCFEKDDKLCKDEE